MSVLEHEIQKAKERAAGINLKARITEIRDQQPGEIASQDAIDKRRKFLDESLDTAKESAGAYERILFGNELQPVSYLERGAIASAAVARIFIRAPGGRPTGYGTGFLIAPGVLITNHHVLPDPSCAAASQAQFGYEVDLGDKEIGPDIFDLDSTALYHTDETLDFTVVGVKPTSTDGSHDIGDYGILPLVEMEGKVMEGEWLTIVQHPAGERKQLCVRENRLIKRAEDVLWYSTDTLAGSSGSPVFNNDWYVVALHHMGVPEEKNGVRQTVDGTPYVPGQTPETNIKWIANEGIRASRIVKALKATLPTHPRLQPLYDATPASARIAGRPQRKARQPKTEAIAIPANSSTKEATMPDSRSITIPLTIQIGVDGASTVVRGGATESMDIAVGEEAAKRKPREARFDVEFDSDYSTRGGYRPGFLGNGKNVIPLPVMDANLLAEAAPLISAAKGKTDYTPKKVGDCLLNYNNYSLVMHKRRKLAIFSAASVSFGDRYELARPRDVWRRDPRILPEYQIEGWYYARNQFDRGHLTRREDLEYGGSVKEALASAADTCHWTNCTPQHAKFNQNKEIWQGIERYILEESIKHDNFNAQIITGPVLEEGDPEYNDIAYPLQFWKVVAALDPNGNLFATAYLASQEDVIGQYGIEEALPLGAYKTFQTTIDEVERITGLHFLGGANTALNKYDPLKQNPPKRRRATIATEEAMSIRSDGRYREIRDFDDIYTG